MLSNKEMGRTGLGLALVGSMVLWGAGAQAQGLGNSPYSSRGLGDFNANTGGVRQMGMGGVGLAAPNAVNVNELNPALLYFTGRTTFEAGFNGQYKTVKNATASNRSGNGTLGYLALSVPLSSKWGAAVGLKPLSAVDYESNILRAVADAAQRRGRHFRSVLWPGLSPHESLDAGFHGLLRVWGNRRDDGHHHYHGRQ
jgi:hypothetical protein